MKKQKAIFFFIGKSSFVEKDIEIYSEHYSLKTFNFNFGAKWKIPIQLINQFFFLIQNITSFKVCFVQLSGIHSFLPILVCKLAGKKSVIIAGGTDCHSFPSIGYGNYQRTLLAFATRASFKFCTLILPKHQSLWRTKYTYDNNDFPEQGIEYFNKNIRTPYLTIENGYDQDKFKRISSATKNSFVTVAGLLNKVSQQKLKGIDLIISVAKYFPDCTFTIIGGEKRFFQNVSDNVKFISSIPNDDLPSILSSNRYYLQLSMAEGFPNALCEAMLCECIPIGSDVFSIPEIIGNTGYILKERNIALLKQLLESLMEIEPGKTGKEARERIKQNYSIEKRKAKLKVVFEKLQITE